jgi:hypothetical protein
MGAALQTTETKGYVKPDLRKGPKLGATTAIPVGSPIHIL